MWCHQSLEQAFRKIAADNAQLVEVQKSPHERTCDALVVHAAIASPHAVADAAWREIAHIHTGADDSLHVVLAPQDCKRGASFVSAEFCARRGLMLRAQ